MKRKVIQIETLMDSVNNQSAIYALCNDGSMFVRWEGEDWSQIPPIPQPEKKEK